MNKNYLIYNHKGEDIIEPIENLKFNGDMMSTIIKHVSGSQTRLLLPFPIFVQIFKEYAELKSNIVDLR